MKYASGELSKSPFFPGQREQLTRLVSFSLGFLLLSRLSNVVLLSVLSSFLVQVFLRFFRLRIFPFASLFLPSFRLFAFSGTLFYLISLSLAAVISLCCNTNAPTSHYSQFKLPCYCCTASLLKPISHDYECLL